MVGVNVQTPYHNHFGYVDDVQAAVELVAKWSKQEFEDNEVLSLRYENKREVSYRFIWWVDVTGLKYTLPKPGYERVIEEAD